MVTLAVLIQPLTLSPYLASDSTPETRSLRSAKFSGSTSMTLSFSSLRTKVSLAAGFEGEEEQLTITWSWSRSFTETWLGPSIWTFPGGTGKVKSWKGLVSNGTFNSLVKNLICSCGEFERHAGKTQKEVALISCACGFFNFSTIFELYLVLVLWWLMVNSLLTYS